MFPVTIGILRLRSRITFKVGYPDHELRVGMNIDEDRKLNGERDVTFFL